MYVIKNITSIMPNQINIAKIVVKVLCSISWTNTQIINKRGGNLLIITKWLNLCSKYTIASLLIPNLFIIREINQVIISAGNKPMMFGNIAIYF